MKPGDIFLFKAERKAQGGFKNSDPINPYTILPFCYNTA
jgi:hypothetical protein